MSAGTPGAPARRGILVVVSAPSGGGKTTLVKGALAADPSLSLSVSCTTRPARKGEVEGRDYFFVPADEFARRRDAGDFAAWAPVFDHAYATPRGPLDEAISTGRDVLLDVDIQGARAIKEAYPEDAVAVFVLPPSMAELERRLRSRGTDSDAQIGRRLARVREELAALGKAGTYDYVVCNDDRERATGELLAIVVAERRRLRRAGAITLD